MRHVNSTAGRNDRCGLWHAVSLVRWHLRLIGASLAGLCSAWLPCAWADDAPRDAEAIRVAVDPRVELMSVVFRLAGNREYNDARVNSYAAAVDQHFAPYRQHPAVVQARSLRDGHGVSYDACMSLAVYLTDIEKLKEKTPLSPWPDGLDERWTGQSVPQFLTAVRQFVHDSSFAEFFRAQRALYDAAEARLQQLIRKQMHPEWFREYFGERRNAAFRVAPALLDGPNSYGPHYRGTDGAEELFCILGVWSVDKEGMPQFKSDVLGTVVHEFCHSYANRLVDRHLAELKTSGTRLFAGVAVDMRSQAYGHWQAMMYESLVRACVLRYTRRYDYRSVVWQGLREEKVRGFPWIEDLFNLLGEYETHRADYATLDAFFPRIVKFFDGYAVKASAQEASLASRRPKVVSTEPANGATDVSPDVSEIRVKFDRLMSIYSWSMVGGGPHFPETTGRGRYNLQRTAWSIPVKLKPDWDYEFMLNSSHYQSFQSVEGVPLAPVQVTFHTGKGSAKLETKTAAPKTEPPPKGRILAPSEKDASFLQRK